MNRELRFGLVEQKELSFEHPHAFLIALDEHPKFYAVSKQDIFFNEPHRKLNDNTCRDMKVVGGGWVRYKNSINLVEVNLDSPFGPPPLYIINNNWQLITAMYSKLVTPNSRFVMNTKRSSSL